jgi:soluble lytic murein transglycosylase
MLRYLLSCIFILCVITASASLFIPEYWVHRYDELIARHARIYRLDEKLVWSIIYEETYFRGWKMGAASEVGLMQVTPPVAREWARETGLKDVERQVTEDVVSYLSDPEKNIQIGCWYLEKLREQYRFRAANTAMTLAAYNAGPSRVEDWTKGTDPEVLTEADFLDRMDIQSTRNYVNSILKRYRSVQPKEQ